MITPADIDKKKFGTTRLKEGYDQDEVDAFLDRVAAEYRQTLKQMAEQQEEIGRLRRALDSAKNEAATQVLPVAPAASAERILVAAQRTADQVEAEANIEAGRIRAVARAEAESLKGAAEAERQTILNQLESERSGLEEQIEILKSKRSGYKSWLRSSLAKIEEEEASGG